jgi:hypothetical protein
MFKFCLVTSSDNSPEEDIQEGLIVTEAAAQLNQLWLEHNGDVICGINCEGVISYDERTANFKDKKALIYTGAEFFKKKDLTCIDIVAMDVAIRRVMGQRAEPFIEVTNTAGLYHVKTEVFLPHGGSDVFDPSLEVHHHGKVVSGHPQCQC